MSFAKLDELGHKLEALEHALAILGADEATHMAVGGGDNPWWLDLLEWGRLSPYGEFFDIQAADDADVEVLDVQPRDRHLLLMVRRPNPVVYVRGKITHPDHATIRLDGWHRVEMNTENRSRAMASVAFLD